MSTAIIALDDTQGLLIHPRTHGFARYLFLRVDAAAVGRAWLNALAPDIRAIDPANLIVVGTPNWSQDVDLAAADLDLDPARSFVVGDKWLDVGLARSIGARCSRW